MTEKVLDYDQNLDTTAAAIFRSVPALAEGDDDLQKAAITLPARPLWTPARTR